MMRVNNDIDDSCVDVFVDVNLEISKFLV